MMARHYWGHINTGKNTHAHTHTHTHTHTHNYNRTKYKKWENTTFNCTRNGGHDLKKKQQQIIYTKLVGQNVCEQTKQI